MKKSIILLFAMMLSGIIANAQGGVDFQELTFEQALEKAKAENKLVFMDCYTSWCGPCKKMLNTVFVQKEAGDFFNTHFINIKYDMEKGEGIELAKRFNVKSYPTFFIIRPDGSIQHKIGGAGTLKSFLSWVEKGLNEETSLDYLNKQYAKGTLDKKQMLDYYTVLLCAGEQAKGKKVLEELKGRLTEKDRQQAEYWFLMKGQPYGSESFNLLVENYAGFKKNIEPEQLEAYLQDCYHQAIDDLFESKEPKNTGEMQVLSDRIAGEWKKMGWQPDARLQNKHKLLRACAEGDSEQIVACIEYGLDKEQFSKWNYDLWMMLGTLEFVDGKDGKENQRILAVQERLLGYFPGSSSMEKRLAPYFEKFK